MFYKRMFLALSCCLWWSYAVTPAQSAVFTLSGRVTDQNTGQGISNVAVTANGNLTGTRVAVTDANGNYLLAMGANNNITFRAYRTNYVFNPLSVTRTSTQIITGQETRDFTGAANPLSIRLFDVAPVLLTEDDSLRALTLNALTRTRDPFGPMTAFNFSADHRTRLVLLLVDLDLFNGELLANTITATAEDVQARLYTLVPEDLRKVPGLPWLSQLTVRLPAELTGPGNVNLRVATRGQNSNSATVRIGSL